MASKGGFLSKNAEIHSLALGTYDGMKTWRVRPKKMRENDDVQAEPHYYAGGYIVGTLLQLGIVAAIAHFGL